MNHDNHLKAADVAAHLDVTVESIPNFDMLSARRTQRMRVMLASAAAVVAVPLGALVGLSQLTGGNDLVIRSAATGAATATGQSASMAGGSLALGNAVTETVVIDQQFRSMRDGFGFANYSGAPKNDIIDASVMSALFTKESVCVDPTAGTCVMLPAAQKIADQMNTAIAVGRCEGMAVLSQRYFDKLDVRVKNASDTIALTQPDVAKQLSYWWATQIAPPVTKESKRFRAMTPSQIVAELETGLKAKKGYTMGIYSSLGGHSVTPIAVTNDGAKKIVYIYDNNYPREVRKLVIDPAAQTWTYAGAATSSGAKASDWTGKGAGTLDLTPMAARKGPFEVSFGATRGLKGTAFAVIVTQDANAEVGAPDVGVRIRGKVNGKSVDISTLNPLDVANAPFEVRNLVGGIAGRGAIAYVPVELANVADGGLELQVIGDKKAGRIQLSVLRTGSATVSVESASEFSVNVSTKGFETVADVRLPDKEDAAEVLISNGPRAAELNLVQGQAVEVVTSFKDDDAIATRSRRIEDTAVSFAIRGGADKQSDVVLSDGVKGAVQSGTAIVQRYDFDESKGTFQVTDVPVQAQPLDTTFVKDMQSAQMPTDQTLVAEEECDPEDLFGPCFGGFRAAALPDTTSDTLNLDTFRGAAPATTVAPTTTIAPTTTTTVPAPTTTTTVPETTTTTAAPPPPAPEPLPLLSMTLTATGTRTYGQNNTATNWNVICTGDCAWWNTNPDAMYMSYGSILSTTPAGTYSTVDMVLTDGVTMPTNLSVTENVTLTIEKAAQTVTLLPIDGRTVVAPDFTVAPVSTSGLEVSLTSETPETCSVSGYEVAVLGAGECVLTATQPGDANYLAATSVSQSFFISKLPNVITASPVADRELQSGQVTVSATATSELAVMFSSATEDICEVSGNVVTLKAVGECSIAADERGDATFEPADTKSIVFDVTKNSQSITFDPLSGKTYGDPSFPVAPTATSGLPVTVTSSSAACSVNALTVTILGAGDCVLTASQSGNTNYNAAQSVPQTFTVNKADQTITFVQPADMTITPGTIQTVAVLPTASSNLTVAVSASGACSVSGPTVTILGAGNCSLTASQGGNENYNAAVSVTQSFTVNKADQTITFAQPADMTITPGTTQTVSVSPTASSNLTVVISASGACSVTGPTVTILGAGDCVLTASQGGNENYNAAGDVTRSFTINKANQTITFGSLSDKTYGDPSFSVSPTASSNLTVAVSASGVCSVSGFTVTILGAGNCSLTASQGGNENYNAAASVTRSFTINKANQTITFGSLSDKTYGDSSFLVTATSDSKLTVELSTSSSACSVSGFTVTILGAGNCSLTASQAGNENYNAAESVTRPFTIAKATTSITITTSTSVNIVAGGSKDASVSASVEPGHWNGSLTWQVGPSSVCRGSGTGLSITVTYVGEGECGISVSIAESDNYTASTAGVKVNVSVTAPQTSDANNGCGNGDQTAPGESGPTNNAENSGVTSSCDKKKKTT